MITPNRILIISRSLYTLIRDKRDEDINDNVANALLSLQGDCIIFDKDTQRVREKDRVEHTCMENFSFLFSLFLNMFTIPHIV